MLKFLLIKFIVVVIYVDKKNIIVVCADFGMGGISKSAIEWLELVDYDKFNITLYIRRNDVLELIDFVPEKVKIITIDSELKKGIYDNSAFGKVIKLICTFAEKIGSKYLAKQIYRWYKYPKQRKDEGFNLRKNNPSYDVAIAYSTSDDIPTFVLKEIKADKKYLFIHQSTPISKENQKTLPEFDSVILVSEYLYDKYKKDFSNKKINFTSLTNYVSYKRIREMAKQESIDRKNIIKFATCGRLVDIKGPDILIDVAIVLKEKGLQFVWEWIGDGACRRKMETAIKENGLEDYVHILGEKINPYPYMASCDIYVQPSKAEASPLTILEALSLGKPVVSTKTVGGQSIFNKYECGILADVSAEALAEKLYMISINEGFRDKETEKARSINWEKEERNYKNMWYKLLSGEI